MPIVYVNIPSQTLEQILTADGSTGGLDIKSPDTRKKVRVTNSSVIASASSADTVNNGIVTVEEGAVSVDVSDSSSGDSSNVSITPTEVNVNSTGEINLNAVSVKKNGAEVATTNDIASAVAGLLDYRGVYDASVNAYPSSGGSGTAGAIVKSDFWIISVAGTLPTGLIVEAGDMIIAKIDSPGNTQANWNIIQYNIGYTPENAANKVSTISASATQYPNSNAVIAYAAALSGSYANPSWIASLAWSKITGTPTTVAGYGITDAVRIIHKEVTDGTVITGTTAQTLTTSFEIPGNTLTVGDIPEISLRAVFTGVAGAKRMTIQLNTSNAVGGTQIATNLTASNALSGDMARRIAIKSATNTEVYNGAINSLLADNVSSTAVTSANIDWTQSVWVIISITLANSADSGKSSFVKLTT